MADSSKDAPPSYYDPEAGGYQPTAPTQPQQPQQPTGYPQQVAGNQYGQYTQPYPQAQPQPQQQPYYVQQQQPPHGAYPQQYPQPGYPPQQQPQQPQQNYAYQPNPNAYPGQPQQQGYGQQPNYGATTITTTTTTTTYGDNENIVKARQIMNSGLFDCLEDLEACVLAYFLAPCVFGLNYSNSGQGCCCPIVEGCCCYPCLCGCGRSGVQRYVGAVEEPCIVNCFWHCICPWCALAQEYRAIKWAKLAYASGNRQTMIHDVSMR